MAYEGPNKGCIGSYRDFTGFQGFPKLAVMGIYWDNGRENANYHLRVLV